MGFDYDPKDASSAIEPGEYEATIKHVQSTDEQGNLLKSKKGEGMQIVTFEVYTSERTRTLKQWFTAKGGLWKYRELASALGQADAFTNKQFDAADHIQAGVVLVLNVEDRPGYGEQNVVEAYKPKPEASARVAVTEEQRTKMAAASKSRLDADDIPF